jgi:hypothetical protein
MKKMNKYEAPKAEMIQINVNKSFMAGGEGESVNNNTPPEEL